MSSTKIADEQADRASRVISAIANAVRIEIVKLFLRAEHNVGELSAAVGLSQSATSQHLAKLKRVGILRQRKTAQLRLCAINPSMAAQLKKLIEIAKEQPARLEETPRP